MNVLLYLIFSAIHFILLVHTYSARTYGFFVLNSIMFFILNRDRSVLFLIPSGVIIGLYSFYGVIRIAVEFV